MAVVFLLPAGYKNGQCLHAHLALFVFAVVGLPTKETTDLYDTFLLLHAPNLLEKRMFSKM